MILYICIIIVFVSLAVLPSRTAAALSVSRRPRPPASTDEATAPRYWQAPYRDESNLLFQSRAERDARLLNGGRSLPFNCSTVDEIIYAANRTKFVRGTTILAYSGSFRGVEVIIKRPRQRTPTGAIIQSDDAIDRFKQEAIMLLELRHPHVVRYLGGCFEKGRIMNVMAKLRPWGAVLRGGAGGGDVAFDWRLRLCAAKRLSRLVRYWSATRHGAYVHCDFFTHQFAFDSSYNPYMIDVDGLLPSPQNADSPCTQDSQCRARNCWKANLWSSESAQKFDPIHEIRCNIAEGRCNGLSHAYNVYAFGRLLLRELFLTSVSGRSAMANAPKGLKEAIESIIRDATRNELNMRLDEETLVKRLVGVYDRYAASTECPSVDV